MQILNLKHCLFNEQCTDTNLNCNMQRKKHHSFCLESLRFKVGSFLFADLSLTTIYFPDCAFLSQIGKCLWEASSLNIRLQWGHFFLSSTGWFCCPPSALYEFALSYLERPSALRTCSDSSFHLGTLTSRMGRLSSDFWAVVVGLGGLAEAILGFRVLFDFEGFGSKAEKSMTLGALEFWDVLQTITFWQVSTWASKSLLGTYRLHLLHILRKSA